MFKLRYPTFTASKEWLLSSKGLVFLFFAGLMTVGLNVYRDYGVPWDEIYTHTYGQQLWEFLFRGDEELLGSRDRFYGPFVELTLTLITHFFKTSTLREDLLLRHLTLFLTFYMGVFCFYRLCVRRHGHRAAGLIGVVLIVLSPRIFADAFYNSKDLAFLSLFIMAALSLQRFVEKPGPGRLLIHAFLSAASITTRLGALMIPVLTVIWLIVACMRGRAGVLRSFASIGVYLALTVLLTLALWPTLWSDPVDGFLKAIWQMSHFTSGPPGVLYRGTYLSILKLPWHYLPTWIWITTPLPQLILFLVGITYSLFSLFDRKGMLDSLERHSMLWIWIFLPLILIIVAQSPVYDGWRQLYFIYPAMILLALDGFILLWSLAKNRIFRIIIVGLLFSGLIPVMVFMVRFHPLQNVYFNLFAGPKDSLAQRYDVDYWGLAYRKGLEFILKIDPRERIYVATSNPPGRINRHLVKPRHEARRILMTLNVVRANYFISNHRTGPLHRPPPKNKRHVHEIVVDGVGVLGIYQ